MARPRHDPPIVRFNTQIYEEDRAWLMEHYGSQYAAGVIRDLVREHRRRIETQNVAKTMREKLK
jgi:hypothetical protein